MELDYGAWEGRTLDEINRRFPGEYEQYEREPGDHHVGGGESGYEVVARLAPLFDELLGWAEEATGRRSDVLLVGHSSVNRIVLAHRCWACP